MKDFCEMTAEELRDHTSRHRAGDPTARVFSITVTWRNDAGDLLKSDLESPTEAHLVVKVGKMRQTHRVLEVSPMVERKYEPEVIRCEAK